MSILPDGVQSGITNPDRASKRQRLTEIIASLGEHADPAKIREEAYRVGFGRVSTDMLRCVRNTLWPQRVKHPGGYTREQMERAKAPLLKALVPCPACGSSRVWAKQCYRYKDGKGGLTGKVLRSRMCRDCGNLFKRAEDDSGKLPSKHAQLIAAAALTEKQCTKCGKLQPIEAFRLRGSSGVVRRTWCKECEAEGNYRSVLRRSLKQFGMSEHEYQYISSRQGNRCAICRSENPYGPEGNFSKKRKRRVFSLDHCHTTGKARGLLCCRCNLAIGLFEDNPAVLRAAANYLESHRSGDTPESV